ncbi:MAG: flavin reductase family protein [Chitinophagales bacterium]|nr:flavin reductase family protein [Chitinophagales bacterium]
MLTIDPKEISVPKLHAFMLASIAPRPIAFASTVDIEGIPNLSPFSFFNAFGSNPPTLIFSPARRVRDNTTKHTLQNIEQVPEVVINTVNFEMVQQASLSSVEFPKGTNEFLKSGFNPEPSIRVKPFRVKESTVQFECRVVEVKSMGNEGGAANLIICEIMLMHISELILTEQGRIDQHKIDLVARLGDDYYVRASGAALFEVPKPNIKPAIGIDLLPESIRLSKVLTGNNLGQLGNSQHIPTKEELNSVAIGAAITELSERFHNDDESFNYHTHILAKEFLDEGNVMAAWKVLLLEDDANAK